jgi:hypothetical protein
MVRFPAEVLLMDPEGVDYWLEYRVLKDNLSMLWDDYLAMDEQELIDRYLHCRGMMDSTEGSIRIVVSVWMKNEHGLQHA